MKTERGLRGQNFSALHLPPLGFVGSSALDSICRTKRGLLPHVTRTSHRVGRREKSSLALFQSETIVYDYFDFPSFHVVGVRRRHSDACG
jgi:hypothetical protein